MTKAYHDNLFVPMFQYACSPRLGVSLVQAYHSDLGHDVISLSRAKPGDLFAWGPRDYGSHLIQLNGAEPIKPGFFDKIDGCMPKDWHLIHVHRVSMAGYAHGTIEHLDCETKADVDYRFRDAIDAQREPVETHFRDWNPWHDDCVYVPPERLAMALGDPTFLYSVEKLLKDWQGMSTIAKVDAYILPHSNSVGIRFGVEGDEYLSPHVPRAARIAALREEFTRVYR